MKEFIRKTTLTLVFAAPVFADPFVIPEADLSVPRHLSQKSIVKFEEGKFSASVDGKAHKIESYDVSGLPSSLTEDQLKRFLEHGYLSLKRVGDSFGIDARVKGLGGGKSLTLEEALTLAAMNAPSYKSNKPPFSCEGFAGMLAGFGIKAGMSAGAVVGGIGSIPGAVVGGIAGGLGGMLLCKGYYRQ